MTKISVIRSYLHLKDGEVGPFTENVLQRLTNNPFVTLTAEELAEGKRRKDDFDAKLVKSIDGTSFDIMQKNESKSSVLDWLSTTAINVNMKVGGDREKIASTGFLLVKEPEKGKVPEKPTNFKVEDGVNNGDLNFSVKANKNARFYVFYYTSIPSDSSDMNTWTSVSSTSSKISISGFKHGNEYSCRCAYIGPDSKPVYSDIITVLAR